MPAVLARTRIRRDFVLIQASGREPRLTGLLHIPRAVVVRKRWRIRRERRVGLERQLVMRQVRRLQRNRFFHIRQCAIDRLFRQRVHQIEVDIVDAGILRHFHRALGFARAVDAADAFQCGVVKTLHAETDAVYPGVAITREGTMLDGARIRLQRDFDVVGQAQPRRNVIDDFRDGVRREQARRTAAEKYTLQHPALRERQILFEVARQRIDIILLRQFFRRVVRIEIAIRAFAHAPRNVDVERQRNGFRREHRTSSPGADSPTPARDG